MMAREEDHASRGNLRRGTTMIELLVVLAILAVLLGTVAPSIPKPSRTAEDDPHRRIAGARRAAMEQRRPVRIVVQRGTEPAIAVLARPDGSVLGGAELGIQLLSGRPEPIYER